MRSEIKKWIHSFFLSIPLALFLLSHYFNHSHQLQATGFIQYDNVSYVANAKQYLEADTFSLFYSNSLNDSENYPRIYFQPQHLILALLMKMHVPAGVALSLFNYLFAIILIRILIAIYELVIPHKKYESISLVLFTWGGGLLSLIGILIWVFGKKSFWDSVFILDPSSGWWGLNLGRSIFFSIEGYYHALFFGAIYLILRKKFLEGLGVIFLLSLSHPFTGIELIIIILGWICLEKLFYKNKSIGSFFIIGMLVIAAFHIYYYLFFLNYFPEHQSVFVQYSLNWRIRFYHFLPAYTIVGACTLISIRNSSVSYYFSNPDNRLFFCWAAIAFLLANHELFIKPMQPIHFTRGYIWSALFLAGIPGLHAILDWFGRQNKRLFAGIFILIFLLDNILWIYGNSRYQNTENSTALLNKEQVEILRFLKETTDKHTLLIGSDEIIPYLSTVYTDSYAWLSHPHNTPFYTEKLRAYREYILEGKLPIGWKNRHLIFLVNKHDGVEVNRYNNPVFTIEKIFETQNFLLYQRIQDGSNSKANKVRR
jgi:hypothetical protein